MFAFQVQPSSFMSEFLDSTDEMTDSSCDGQSDEETPEDKTKTMTGMSQSISNSPGDDDNNYISVVMMMMIVQCRLFNAKLSKGLPYDRAHKQHVKGILMIKSIFSAALPFLRGMLTNKAR